MAAVTADAILTRLVRELVTRTSLIIRLFGMSGVSSGKEHEHLEVLERVCNRDGDGADALIRTHLNRIEAGLNLSRVESREPDVVEILSNP